jgi:hypothetical protein
VFHVIKHSFTQQYGNILLKELVLFFGKSKNGNFELKDYCIFSLFHRAFYFTAYNEPTNAHLLAHYIQTIVYIRCDPGLRNGTVQAKLAHNDFTRENRRNIRLSECCHFEFNDKVVLGYYSSYYCTCC